MFNFRKLCGSKAVRNLFGASLLALAGINVAHATIILEGSDSIGYHSRLGDAGAIVYRDQVWSAIGGADARSIAFIGDALGGVASGTHAVSTFSSVAAAGSLSNYVAVYFQAHSGCCTENDNLVATAAERAAVTGYLASGGTIMIGDYNGGAAWDFALGTVGGAGSHVQGVGGALGGAGCSDGEQVTAAGLANGFSQPPVIGCWTHQAYDQAGFFGGLGFTSSFFDAGPAYSPGFSSLLSNGKTVTGSVPVPEPASLALLAIGALGAAALRRRKPGA